MSADRRAVPIRTAIAEARALYDDDKPFEAHEVLEDAWHACGRVGAEASLLKALIKLCAGRVKRADHNALGVASHTAGVLALVDELVRMGVTEIAGVSCAAVADEARALAAAPPGEPVPRRW